MDGRAKSVRVLFCRSNPIDPDPRVEKEAQALSQAGYQVQVIAWDRTGELPSPEKKDGFTIYRLPIPADYAQGMGNLSALLRWEWGLFWWLVNHRQRFDLIHACDFDTVLPAMLCKWLFRKKLVYDIFDFYADHLRKTPEFIKRLIRWADLRVITWADGVILVDDVRREQIQGSKPKLLAVIYNSPDDVHDQLKIVNQEKADRELHIVYVGLLQFERGLMELLSVLETHPDWQLDLAGFGGDADAILEKAQTMSNVTWQGRIPYQRTLELTARADVSFATYDPIIPNHRLASPNKIFEAMMLGKPIIVAEDTNMDHITGLNQCGLVVEYGNLQQLEKALSKLEKNPKLRCTLGTKGREAYLREYSWGLMANRLLDLYQGVLEV